MKRIMLMMVIVLLTGTGVAWGGYKLVMSKDKELCTSVLKLFNDDIKKYRVIEYERHDIFKKVPWERVEIDADRDDASYCSVVLRAKFDINNDGQDEYVIKWSACMRGFAFDNLYIYPLDNEWVKKPIWKNMSLLGQDTSNKFENIRNSHELKELDPAKNDGLTASVGGTILQPFIWGTTAYVVLTDLFHGRWIVIAKYIKGAEFKDICYFRDRSQSE